MNRRKETRPTYHSERVSSRTTATKILPLSRAQILAAFIATTALLLIPAAAAAVYQSIAF